MKISTLAINYIHRSIGQSALLSLLLGCFALLPTAQAVSPSPDGGYPGGNTAEGQNALFSLGSGAFNTAVGWLSLESVTTGNLNTGVGAGTLALNTGDNNTATGAAALLSNESGFNNTANGSFALSSNTTGNRNTAVGRDALSSDTTGNNNTAVGAGALSNNAASSNNTAVGREALFSNTTGESNVAIGRGTLANNTTGDSNLALGIDAGNQVTTASNVIAIGHTGADVSNSTWIDNVYNVTTQSGTTAPVIVSNTGQLGTLVSSERFKKDIATMEKASEAILSFRPVTFHYRTDGTNTPQFGLVAEEVAKVNPALVLSDKEGKPYTVRYDAVNAMLLNEFLKEHKTVQKQGATIARLQNQIEVLTAGLQKVSTQLEANESRRQVVAK
jgi:hypothetical protein